jgi:hypothetical protein
MFFLVRNKIGVRRVIGDGGHTFVRAGLLALPDYVAASVAVLREFISGWRWRSAELDSAVSQIWNLQSAGQSEALGRPAGCKSAIRQIENLRCGLPTTA